MRKEPNKAMVGLFIVIGFVSLFLIFAHAIAVKILPDNEDMFVMYFDESVKGLSVGSPVVFKGVELGRVAKIEMVAAPNNSAFEIPVYVQMTRSQGAHARGAMTDQNQMQLLEEFVEKGMRARLVSQNFLTGQLMVELEMFPGSPAIYRHVDKKIPEIPTVLSQIGEVSRNIQNLPIRQTLEGLNKLLEETNKTMPQILKETNLLVTQSGTVMVDLNRTLADIGEAAKAFRNFTDYLERHPEALLKGKGGY